MSLERLAGYKHSSLFRFVIIGEEISLKTLTPRSRDPLRTTMRFQAAPAPDGALPVPEGHDDHCQVGVNAIKPYPFTIKQVASNK